MSVRFDGKVIIVTGAGAGLGRAAAQRLASEGAKLSLVDLRADAEASQEVILAESPAAELLLITADVSVEGDVESYVVQTQTHFGRIDGLYNNAGIEGKQALVGEYDSDVFDR